jgi:hypothetical protein
MGESFVFRRTDNGMSPIVNALTAQAIANAEMDESDPLEGED